MFTGLGRAAVILLTLIIFAVLWLAFELTFNQPVMQMMPYIETEPDTPEPECPPGQSRAPGKPCEPDMYGYSGEDRIVVPGYEDPYLHQLMPGGHPPEKNKK